MSEQRSGRIVNIGFINGFTPWLSDAAYVAAKAGLVGLSKKIAMEMAPYGVTCNVVAPSMVLGPMSQKSVVRFGLEGAIARFPLGRLCEARDVANAAVFLASEAASFITGQVIHVNGGAYMG